METLAQTLTNQLPYEVRVLTHADDDEIYRLQQKNQSYFDLFLDHKLTRQEAVADVDELASEAAAAQKYYLGVFNGSKLVAIIDLTVDYPLPQLVWLGQFFVDDAEVTASDRSLILSSVIKTLKALSAVQIQLLVLKADTDNQQFYAGEDFKQVSDTRAKVNDQFVDVWVYQKDL